MRSLFRWLAPKPALPAPTELSGTADLGDELKKLARAHGRSALRVEEVERKIDALGVALATLTARVTAPTPPTQTDDDITSVFDAMDTLDEAVHSVPADAPALAAGLIGVLTRLDRFIAARGYTRIAALGQPPDGALVRVVGVEVASGIADGAVTRVVRAPIRRGDRVVRQGEVITKQKEAP